MPARDQQHQIGKADPVGQPWCQGMARQMIDANQRQSSTRRDPLGHHHPCHDAADQSRSSGHGHGGEIAQAKTGLVQRLFNAMIQPLGMGARGDFRNDAAEIRVHFGLTGDNRRQNAPVAGDDGGSSVIATAFDAKENQVVHALARRGNGAYPEASSTAGWKLPMPSRMTAGLLLTRPEADSRRLAAMLPEFEAVISPILRIEPVAHDAARLRAAQGLVFTSAHAVASAGPGRGRLALCVGGRTAQVARDAGFVTLEGNGFAESLLPLIESAEVTLIHPHGRHLARELPVEGMVVYDQIAQPLNKEARDLLAGKVPVLLPLFSPRSARVLDMQTRDCGAELWIVAISPAAAEAWNGPCDRRIVAASPTAEAMTKAIRLMAGMEQS